MLKTQQNFLVMGTWRIYLTVLDLRSLICKMKLKTPYLRRWYELNEMSHINFEELVGLSTQKVANDGDHDGGLGCVL